MAAKTTAFDLQTDPSRPGMSVHRLDRAKGQHCWSVRVDVDPLDRLDRLKNVGGVGA